MNAGGINCGIHLERLQYRQGQTLLGCDFRDQAAFDAQLRWWHNRAEHQKRVGQYVLPGFYGVVLGIGDSLVVDTANGTTIVKSGLAYDAYGRDLILARTRQIPTPVFETNSETEWTLVGSYAEAGPARGSGSAAGCFTQGSPIDLAEMAIAWFPSSRVTPRDGVFLAVLKNDGKKPDMSQRPLARGLSRPHIVSGATIQGATRWTVWPGPVTGAEEIHPTPLGVQVQIDTSGAGFTSTPCYFAWLQGPAWGPVEDNQMVWFLGDVQAETAQGFFYRLLMLGNPILGWSTDSSKGSADPDAFLRLAEDLELSVFWLGIEPLDSQCSYKG